MGRFGVTVTPPVWQASIEGKFILSLLKTWKAIVKHHLEMGLLFETRHAGDLKTRNNHKSGSLGTPFHGRPP
jgi:hypothetical protein